MRKRIRRTFRSNRPCDLRLVREVIEDMVARAFEVDLALVHGPTRGIANAALARQVAMYLTHITSGLTYTEVGTLFERDRTTVRHACRLIERRRDEKGFDNALEMLEHIALILTGPAGVCDAAPPDEPPPEPCGAARASCEIMTESPCRRQN